MKRIIRRFRAWLFGECPQCHSLRIKDVHGWAKQECRDCGHCWSVGL